MKMRLQTIFYGSIACMIPIALGSSDTCDSPDSCPDTIDDSLGPRCPSYKGAVKRISWNKEDGPFANKIAHARVPVVLTNTDVNTWKALNKWTREYVRDELFKDYPPPNVDVRTQAATIQNSKAAPGELSIFTIRSHSRSGETMQTPNEVIHGNYTLKRENLLKVAQEKKTIENGVEKKLYSYHSGPILKWGDHTLDDLEPWDSLRAVDERMESVAGDDSSHGIIHFGEQGVVAQMHHDRNRNFFGQLVGRKRVLLFEPKAHFDMYVYPITHPSRRQSQVHFTDGFGAYNEEKFPDFKHSNCFEAIIGPGDLLYIPPFWFHMVQYLDFASSYSIVSPSLPEWMFSKMYSHSLPLKQMQTKNDKSLLMVKFIGKIMQHLDTVQEFQDLRKERKEKNEPWSSDFIKQYLKSRFNPLEYAMSDTFDPDLVTEDGCWFSKHMTESQLRSFSGKLDQVLDPIAKTAFEDLTKGPDSMLALGFVTEAEILFADMIEDYARYVVGVQNISLFVKCLGISLTNGTV